MAICIEGASFVSWPIDDGEDFDSFAINESADDGVTMAAGLSD